MSRYYHGEFHRSAHDNTRQYNNSRHLGYDHAEGGMKGIFDHSVARPQPPARPRDGGSMLSAMNHDAPVEERPTPRHRVAAPTSSASVMSSLLTHGMAPVEVTHRGRDGSSMAALLSGEELPVPAVGSSEAINSKMLPPGGRKACGGPVGLADPRESAMQRLQLAYREVVKLLCSVGASAREHDGSLTPQVAKEVLHSLDAAGVHMGTNSAGALLALCDTCERSASLVRLAVPAAAKLAEPATHGSTQPPACARRHSGLQGRAAAAWVAWGPSEAPPNVPIPLRLTHPGQLGTSSSTPLPPTSNLPSHPPRRPPSHPLRHHCSRCSCWRRCSLSIRS